jgi:hypothetical protein
MDIRLDRWWQRKLHIGPATMVRDNRVDNLWPSIICRDFWLQGNMRRNENYRDVERLEGGSLWLRVYYSMNNLVKSPILEQLVQFLGINIKMNGKSRPSRTYIPISPASVISTMAYPTEETHPIAIVC